MDDGAAGSDPSGEAEEREIEAAELRATLAAQSHQRAVRLARVSRLVFALGVVLLVALALVWVLGVLSTADVGFRVLGLAVVVFLGLAFLAGALSAAASRRSS